MKIYMAPMEGITDVIFRNTYREFFGGIDKYFTPFLSPTDDRKFSNREKRNINPKINDINTVVPQLITCKSEHFIWGMKEIAQHGFREINLNLGCPSGTVVAKKKGSGFLAYPDELDKFLDEIFNAASLENINISVKTRLGKNAPDEFFELLDIFNKYPIFELTIHPRIQTDFYKNDVRREYFDYAYENSKNKLVYNGDIKTSGDITSISDKYSNIDAVMIGRGLVSTPGLDKFNLSTFVKFHDSLLSQYEEELSGERPLLWRMKEMWAFWGDNFDCEKKLKALKKCQRLSVYKDIVNEIIELSQL